MTKTDKELDDLASQLSSLDELELRAVLDKALGFKKPSPAAMDKYKQRLIAAAQNRTAPQAPQHGSPVAEEAPDKDAESDWVTNECFNCEYCGNISRGLVENGRCVICGEKILLAKIH